uniref:Allergen Ale o 7 n=1 Tax=Aleuroglyphus ovatus TaxID=212130 RepID=B0KZK4_ALEOV|nr:allergen Ale o 7 [Aleuroglyphus ovatus]
MKSIALVACLAGLALADQSTDTANQFVDQFIQALKAKNGFDPMHIGEHTSTITERIGFLDVKIKVDLHKTVIAGLGKASRIGDAAVQNTNGAFNAKLRLGDNDVRAESDITVHIGPLIHPDLKLEADIGHLTITFGVEIGSDGKPGLKEFNIDELEHVKVHVHGEIELLDPVIDVISQAFVKMFNSLARDMITQVVKPVLEDEIKILMGPKN